MVPLQFQLGARGAIPDCICEVGGRIEKSQFLHDLLPITHVARTAHFALVFGVMEVVSESDRVVPRGEN